MHLATMYHSPLSMTPPNMMTTVVRPANPPPDMTATRLPVGAMERNASQATTPSQLFEATPMSMVPPFPFNQPAQASHPRPLIPPSVIPGVPPHPKKGRATPEGRLIRQRLDERHHERVRNYVSALELWARLEEENPSRRDPEEGFNTETIEAARRCKEHVQTGIYVSTARAFEDYRSRKRTHIRNGGREEDLQEVYNFAYRNYIRRFSTT